MAVVEDQRRLPTDEEIVHRRAGHVTVSYDNRLYMWGGYMELPHGRPYNLMTPSRTLYHSAIHIWIYDPLLDTWTRKLTHGDHPLKLSGSCAAVIDCFMYLFGGFHCGSTDVIEGDLNILWRLNLQTLIWKRLSPGGIAPYKCDKLSCWVHGNRFYVFGGYGDNIYMEENPELRLLVDCVVDETNNWRSRGWLNQLAYYDTATYCWVWPQTHGVKPCPRAALATAVAKDVVFIFGGRHQSQRLNDLHCLNLNTFIWSGSCNGNIFGEIPTGRSWHSLNFVSENKAVLYGGFSQDCHVLSDVWVLETNVTWESITSVTWVPVTSVTVGARLWHSASHVYPGELFMHGGIRNNILDMSKEKRTVILPPDDCWLLEIISGNPSDGIFRWLEVDLAYDHGIPRCCHCSAVAYAGELIILSGLTQPFYLQLQKLIDHAEVMLCLRFSSPTLFRLALEAVSRVPSLQHQWHLLPQPVQNILKIRQNGKFIEKPIPINFVR